MLFAILGHLIGTAFRAFWRILTTAVICAVIGAVAVMAVVYVYTRQIALPPHDQLTLVALASVTVLSAYAGGVTALMTEAVRALKQAAKLAEKEVVAPLQAVGRELEGDKH